MFSILILTKNEEANLPACVESVFWCDDIVVLDSFSEDRTCDVAVKLNARVFKRRFDNFGSQRNYALDHISFKNKWVFHLDADERFNEELRQDCERAISNDTHSAFLVPNRIIFLGRWIRRSTQFPFPQVRLLKLGEIRFIKAGHGQKEDQALRGIGHIHTAYDHYNFSKGIAEWVDKHNRYSSEEATYSMDTKPISWSSLVSGDTMLRKRTLKKLHTRMPIRWAVKFFYLYFIRMGFLDFYPGFAYCVLQSFYDFLITIKISEKEHLHLSHSRDGTTVTHT